MTPHRPVPPPDPGFALRIRELVIDGFAPNEARAIGVAFEKELGRILADRAPRFAGRRAAGEGGRITVDRIDAGTVTRPSGGSPQAVGQGAARAIVRNLRTLATRSAPVPRDAT